jgi:hypothetical protein
MKINLPTWAEGIEDEGIAIFVAFCSRVCDLYGYDTQYYISKDDVGRMTNKIQNSIVEWLRRSPQINDNILLGDILDTTIVFTIKTKDHRRKAGRPAGYRKRQRNAIKFELESHRSQLTWIYLLGCLNHNIVSDEPINNKGLDNTYGIKEFNITREAAKYIANPNRKPYTYKQDVEMDD